MLCALDFHLGPVDEVAVVGDLEDEETRETLRLVRHGFAPHRVLAFMPVGDDTARLEEALPLLSGKKAENGVTMYVCRDFACQAPVVGVEGVREILSQPLGRTIN